MKTFSFFLAATIVRAEKVQVLSLGAELKASRFIGEEASAPNLNRNLKKVKKSKAPKVSKKTSKSKAPSQAPSACNCVDNSIDFLNAVDNPAIWPVVDDDALGVDTTIFVCNDYTNSYYPFLGTNPALDADVLSSLMLDSAGSTITIKNYAGGATFSLNIFVAGVFMVNVPLPVTLPLPDILPTPLPLH